MVLQLTLILPAPRLILPTLLSAPFCPGPFCHPAGQVFWGWQDTHGNSPLKVDQISSPSQGMLRLGSRCLRWDGRRWDGPRWDRLLTAALQESSPQEQCWRGEGTQGLWEWQGSGRGCDRVFSALSV